MMTETERLQWKGRGIEWSPAHFPVNERNLRDQEVSREWNARHMQACFFCLVTADRMYWCRAPMKEAG